jgi:hypothetical protein
MLIFCRPDTGLVVGCFFGGKTFRFSVSAAVRDSSSSSSSSSSSPEEIVVSVPDQNQIFYVMLYLESY